MSAFARFSPSTAEASAWASLMRMSRSASFTSASRWKTAVCSPIFCSFSNSATRTACSRRASRVPISRTLWALATLTDFSRSASATRTSPICSLSATSPRAFWIACEAAFWPMASI